MVFLPQNLFQFIRISQLSSGNASKNLVLTVLMFTAWSCRKNLGHVLGVLKLKHTFSPLRKSAVEIICLDPDINIMSMSYQDFSHHFCRERAQHRQKLFWKGK